MNRLLLLSFLFAVSLTSAGAPVRDNHVAAELIARDASAQPGSTTFLGVRLSMDEHWHTYWKNCGDFCQPTAIKWTLPAGVTAGAIQWPYPERYSADDVTTYGYEGEVLLQIPVTVSKDVKPGTSIDLKANVSWLMCMDMCIPGSAALALSLPVTVDAPKPDPAHAAIFDKSTADLPKSDTGWTFSATATTNTIVLIATPPSTANKNISSAYFFAEDESVVNYAGTQVWSSADAAYQLVIPRAADSPQPGRLHGVLVSPQGWLTSGTTKALQVDIPVTKAGAVSAVSQAKGDVTPAAVTESGFLLGLAGMFFGGLILNLMPCVFPVLALKIVGFVESAKEGHGKATQHAFAFTAGVMLSMWVLAGILIALRGAGGTAGWAVQMSNPYFVLGLIVLFLLIGLNMFGVFEFGLSLTTAGGGLQAKKGMAGSFFSGLLTTVAGAPCAGPFLGSAIGYSLQQPPLSALVLFTAMGIGTALPYATLSCFPAALKFLPKPGAWMDTFKQLMGFPMVATAVWFGATYVKLQGGQNAELRVDALKSLLFGSVLVAMAAWAYGKWTALHREPGVRWTGRVVALLLLASGLAVAMDKSRLVYETWSPARVAQLQREGKPVLVDFTAEWCAICQVNKRIALENAHVIEKLKEKGVTVLIADWTDHNAEVADGLKAFERAAVPLYLVYGKDATKPPEILPQALTPGIVVDALDRIR